jgi:hypothetical protein
MTSTISFQFTLSSDKYKISYCAFSLYKTISPYLGVHNENKRSQCFPLNICTLKWYKECTWGFLYIVHLEKYLNGIAFVNQIGCSQVYISYTLNPVCRFITFCFVTLATKQKEKMSTSISIKRKVHILGKKKVSLWISFLKRAHIRLKFSSQKSLEKEINWWCCVPF